MRILWEVLAATVGSAAFALLFSVPSRHYLVCALLGGASWLIYALAQLLGAPAGIGVLAGAFAVALLSRFLAVWRACPSTVLMIPGLFPLIPGAGVYWTIHHLVTNDLSLARQTGFTALKMAVAIVFGVVLAFELPQKLFTPKKK